MTDPNDSAFTQQHKTVDKNLNFGLTKREYFSAMAMQGLASNPNATWDYVKGALYAIQYADALITELNK